MIGPYIISAPPAGGMNRAGAGSAAETGQAGQGGAEARIETLYGVDRLTGMAVLLHHLPDAGGDSLRLPPLPASAALLPITELDEWDGQRYALTELPHTSALATHPGEVAAGVLAALVALHRAQKVHGGVAASQFWHTGRRVRLAGAGLPWSAGASAQDDLRALAAALDALGGRPAALRRLETMSAAEALATLEASQPPPPAQSPLPRSVPLAALVPAADVQPPLIVRPAPLPPAARPEAAVMAARPSQTVQPAASAHPLQPSPAAPLGGVSTQAASEVAIPVSSTPNAVPFAPPPPVQMESDSQANERGGSAVLPDGEGVASPGASDHDERGVASPGASDHDERGVASPGASDHDERGVASPGASDHDERGVASPGASDHDDRGVASPGASVHDERGVASSIQAPPGMGASVHDDAGRAAGSAPGSALDTRTTQAIQAIQATQTTPRSAESGVQNFSPPTPYRSASDVIVLGDELLGAETPARKVPVPAARPPTFQIGFDEPLLDWSAPSWPAVPVQAAAPPAVQPPAPPPQAVAAEVEAPPPSQQQALQRTPRNQPMRIGWEEDQSWRVVKEAPAAQARSAQLRSTRRRTGSARPVPPRRRPAWLLLLVLLGLAGVGGWWALRSQFARPLVSSCCPVLFKVEGETGTPVRITVVQAPSGSPLKPGTLLGTAPATLRLPDVPGSYQLKFEASGHAAMLSSLKVPASAPFVILLK